MATCPVLQMVYCTFRSFLPIIPLWGTADAEIVPVADANPEVSEVPSVTRRVASCAWPTARTSAFLISAFLVYSSSFGPQSSSNVEWRVSRTVYQAVICCWLVPEHKVSPSPHRCYFSFWRVSFFHCVLGSKQFISLLFCFPMTVFGNGLMCTLWSWLLLDR